MRNTMIPILTFLAPSFWMNLPSRVVHKPKTCLSRSLRIKHWHQLSKMTLKFWEVTLKTHWKVFEKGMNINLTSHVKGCSSTTCHVLLAEFGELLVELYTLKQIMSFQQWLAHLPTSWLVNQVASFSSHLVEKGANTWHKSTTMWKAS